MKSAPLMKSISGIRGIVGKSFDPPTVVKYSAAFGRLLNRGKVVVGRDSRPSGKYFSQLVCSTLVSMGCEVIDLGIVPTPTVELEVIYHQAAGGIAITASHNPAEWNALKFFNSRGEFISGTENKKLEKFAAAQKPDYVPYNSLGSLICDDKAIERHIKSVLKVKAIYPAKIKKRKFKAVVDAVNGAGSVALPEFLERLGVKVTRINCRGDGDFRRSPEPVAKNLAELSKAVRKHGADIGLACDPDADRLALVDEAGYPIGEELTLTLSVAYYLMKNKGPVAINLSTSRATADVARMIGCPVFYSPVGEANVISEMRKRKAVIGGEGNGGVILPECHYGRDALVGAGLVMTFLSETGKSLSSLAGTIPAYNIIKKKAPLPNQFDNKLKKVEKGLSGVFGQVKIDRRDGLRFDLLEGWVQVRKSNTEPIYRLIVEARSKRLAYKMMRQVKKALG